MRHAERYIWLDATRGACAVAVCANHLRAVAIVDYADAGSVSVLQKAFYFSTGLGHQAVMVFFVLSGFFVGGAALRDAAGFDVRRYATARLTRLWMVLIPALVATALADLVLGVCAPGVLSGAYRSLWSSGPGADAPYSASLGTFAANALFMQTIVAPVFGTNGPLWSLANEFWYYVLFAVALVALGGFVEQKKQLSMTARSALGISGIGLAAWLPPALLDGFLIWGMGLVVHLSMGRTPGRAAAGLLVGGGAVVFASALVYSKSDAMQRLAGIPSDFVVGAAFCLLAIGVVNARGNQVAASRLGALARRLADCSFSLYLLHFPLVALIGALFYGGAKVRPDVSGLTVFGGWLGVLLASGFAFYSVFERRTDGARRWIDGRLPSTRAIG